MPKKVDSAQAPIVAFIRSLGGTWQTTAMVGKGAPDGWIGYCGLDQSAEIKTGKAKEMPHQILWGQKWRGAPKAVLRTTEDARELLESMARKAAILARHTEAP